MRIATIKEQTKLNIVFRAYLVICVFLFKCFNFIRKVVSWGFRKLRNARFRKLGNINLSLVTMPTLIAGLIYCISLILDTHNANIKATKGIEALASQNLFLKPLPTKFFEEIDLNCNRDNVVINLKSDQKIYSTKLFVSNNSDYPLLLRRGGLYAFHIRPRLWDETITKVVTDGIRISPQYEGIVLIYTKDTFSTQLIIDVSKLGNIPVDAKYLVFGIVQEGVQWAPSKGCKFEVNRG